MPFLPPQRPLGITSFIFSFGYFSLDIFPSFLRLYYCAGTKFTTISLGTQCSFHRCPETGTLLEPCSSPVFSWVVSAALLICTVWRRHSKHLGRDAFAPLPSSVTMAGGHPSAQPGEISELLDAFSEFLLEFLVSITV